MNIIFIAFIIFTFVYEPLIGYFQFKKFQTRVKEQPNQRINYYRKVAIGLWIPTIVILLLVFFTELSMKDIGLSIPAINTTAFGSILTYIVIAIAGFYFVAILYYIIGYHTSQKIKTKFNEDKKKQTQNISYAEILPVTDKEKKMWSFVSFTAGVTEEIIYRGFLILSLSYLLPDASIWIVVVLASILFGLAHTYQGFLMGVLRTTLVGMVFSILYIGLGSIIPLIIFHFLVNYLGKLGEGEKI